ncbi:hypothetical protein PHLCEN_2v11912 [Hermanssonia centrifuga]|uniref:F-box domain-containing protein n=1 Tax=Hermanssonia centrifuga TaxID=98765 RepID=A0A2R6NII7_9APHY|nr:hypothetical protein PHLCEN_2v11912 [Hermanssonia centrifuga]
MIRTHETILHGQDNSSHGLTLQPDTLLLLSNLPAELLAEIFQQYVVMMQQESRQESTVYFRPYHWLRVGGICRVLRHSALQSPLLWNYIVITDHVRQECIEEMLARSQQAPLSVRVRIRTDAEQTKSLLSLICAQLHRVQDLEFSGPWNMLEYVSDRMGTENPALRSLKIAKYAHWGSSVYWQEAKLPFTTEFSHLERLTTVSLTLANLPPCFLRPSLKHLEIHANFLPTFPVDFLNILLQLPLLETIHTEDTQRAWEPYREPVNVRASAPIVTLPHLQSVVLSSSGLLCAYFLEHLSFPSDARIDITCLRTLAAERRIEEDYLIPAIASKFNAGSNAPTGVKPSKPLLSFAARLNGKQNTIILEGWPVRDPEIPFGRACPVPKVRLSFSPFAWSNPFLRKFCGALNLSDVQTAYVGDGLPKPKSGFLAQAFGGMHALRVMHVCGESADDLPEVLDITGDDVTFPHLESLTLERVAFRDFDGPEDDDFAARLEKALTARKQVGAIAQIHIRSASNLSAKDVENMRVAGMPSVWDGIEDIERG